MPEGDSLRRAAEHLRVLEGEVVNVDAPHPRAAALGIAERLDGKRLEQVEAVGKNLVLTFEDGIVLRSHLRMRGRWNVRPLGAPRTGQPWLVLQGASAEALLWNGPVLTLGRRGLERLGPDVLDDPPDLDGMVRRLRAAAQERQVGEALVDQRLVAGIGNMWKAEALWLAGVSPWVRLGDLDDGALRDMLATASQAMREGRRTRAVHRRAGRPCRRCGEVVRSRPQGDDARISYWCPGCQRATAAAGSPPGLAPS